jgi:hypothetical protein
LASSLPAAPPNERSILITLAALIAKVLIVMGIPLIAERISAQLIDRLSPPDRTQVPLTTAPPKLLGMALGLIFVAERYAVPRFDIQSLFLPGGPWDLTLWEFLAGPANPAAYRMGQLYDCFAHQDAGTAVAIALVLAGLTLASALTPFTVWERRVVWGVVLVNLATAVMATYLTIYAIVLLLWLLHLLNFWVFAVLAAAFQYYRSRA